MVDSAFIDAHRESPFDASADRDRTFLEQINALTAHHHANCSEYAAVVERIFGPDSVQASSLAEVPFLPAAIFKHRRLQSVPDEAVVRVLASSGTTSQIPSRVVLDRRTSTAQRRVLSAIVSEFVGDRRLPMLIIDREAELCPAGSEGEMRARGAGIVGMMPFGRDHQFALTDDLELDTAAVEEFLERHADENILVFGFTFMVWKFLVESGGDTGIDLSRGILIHGGGWKGMADRGVSRTEFRSALRSVVNLTRIHDYYGMVEQVGSIFVECEEGWLHTSVFSDVLLRSPRDWKVVEPPGEGVLQAFSVLPTSYPGHAVLTEDRAQVAGVDDCPCGRSGTRLRILGRLPRAELRGCSDAAAREYAS